jgi:hypothetical protein
MDNPYRTQLNIAISAEDATEEDIDEWFDTPFYPGV